MTSPVKPGAIEAIRDVKPKRSFSQWSFLRYVLEQGMAIERDCQAGKYPEYELLSARLDEAARERDTELSAASDFDQQTLALDSARRELKEAREALAGLLRVCEATVVEDYPEYEIARAASLT